MNFLVIVQGSQTYHSIDYKEQVAVVNRSWWAQGSRRVNCLKSLRCGIAEYRINCEILILL